PAPDNPHEFTRVVAASVSTFCLEIHKAIHCGGKEKLKDVFRERRLEQTELVTSHFLNGICDIVQACVSQCDTRLAKKVGGWFFGLGVEEVFVETATSQVVRKMLFQVIPQILSVTVESVATINSDVGIISKRRALNVLPYYFNATREAIRRQMRVILNTIFAKFPQLFVESVLSICRGLFPPRNVPLVGGTSGVNGATTSTAGNGMMRSYPSASSCVRGSSGFGSTKSPDEQSGPPQRTTRSALDHSRSGADLDGHQKSSDTNFSAAKHEPSLVFQSLLETLATLEQAGPEIVFRCIALSFEVELGARSAK
ncbi:unnamed protein product, partial [Amoebophrya sp. A25]